MKDSVRDAVARVKVSKSRGTGFLVAERLVLTALHVVAKKGASPEWLPGPIHLEFPGHRTTATVLENYWNVLDDWVLLRCSDQPPCRPIPRAQLDEDGMAWETWGYPDANERGLGQAGTVRSLRAQLDNTRLLQLSSVEAGAGKGARVKGWSGSPVIVEDAVVGFLRSALLDVDARSEAGTVYACPIERIAPGRDVLPPLGELPSVRAARIAAAVSSLGEPVFRDHELFGGREREMEALDRFVDDRAAPYVLVTAPAGFGKTALLANWIRLRERARSSICYHFVNRDHGLADQDTTLRSLVRQLQAYHGLSFAIPEKIPELRTLFRKLLTEPARPSTVDLVVVLDGLDEADGWTPDRDLFPRALPDDVHVVVSARDTGKDWPAALGLTPPAVHRLPLERLGADGVARLLSKLGNPAAAWARRPEVAQAVVDLSDGDPFYVHFLVEDIRDGVIASLDHVAARPKRLEEYLESWWSQAITDGDSGALLDFFGYLVVARGELTKADLLGVDSGDHLDPIALDRIMKRLGRFLRGNEQTGWVLCHDRFRDYLESSKYRLPAYRKKYEDRVQAYCASWKDHQSRFALTQYALRLAAGGRRAELRAVLDAEWMATKWRTLGSFTSVIRDLSAAAGEALTDPPDYPEAMALMVARQTIREQVAHFPEALLVAWWRLGERERVLDLLESTGGEHGSGIDSLIQVAGEILLSSRADPARRAPDTYVGSAIHLLARAIQILPEIRLPHWRRNAFLGIVNILRRSMTLPPANRAKLLGDAGEFARRVANPADSVALLALTSWATQPWDAARATELSEEAKKAVDGIRDPSDAWQATMSLLPALDASGQPVMPILREAFRKVALPRSMSFSAEQETNSYLHSKTAWLPEDADDARKWLEEFLAAPAKMRPGVQRGTVARAFVAAGFPERGFELIDALDPVEKALAVAIAGDALSTSDGPRARQLLDMGTNLVDHLPAFDALHERYASAALRRGDVNAAIQFLSRADPIRRLRLGRRLLMDGEENAASAPVPADVVTRILAAAMPESAQDAEGSAPSYLRALRTEQSELLAAAARLIAYSAPELSRRHGDRAAGLALSKNPETTTGILRPLLAAAEHDENNPTGAASVLEAMDAVSALRTLRTLAEAGAPDVPIEYVRVAKELLSRVSDAGPERPPEERWAVFEAFADLVLVLERRRFGATNELARHLDLCLASLPVPPQSVGTVAAALLSTNRERGMRLVQDALAMIERRPGAAGPEAIQLLRGLKATATIPGDGRLFLDRARSIGAEHRSISQTIAMDAAYAASLALVDADAAATIVRDLLQRVDQIPTETELESGAAAAIAFLRASGPLHNKLIGSQFDRAAAIGRLAEPIPAIAQARPELATRLIKELYEAAAGLHTPPDRAQAIVDLLATWQTAPKSVQAAVTETCGAAVDVALAIAARTPAEKIVERAAATLAAFGAFDDAELVVARIPASPRRESLTQMISIERKRAALPTLSSFERVLVDVPQPEIFRMAVVFGHDLGTELPAFLKSVMSDLVDEKYLGGRRGLLEVAIRGSLDSVFRVGGAAAVATTLDRIDAWDCRVQESAAKIAGLNAPPSVTARYQTT